MVVCAAPLSLILLNTGPAHSGRLPDGWTLKVLRGAPDVAAIEGDSGQVLRLKSRNSSFGVERAVSVDLSQYPYLAWRWKVSELPRGGDFRRSASDDQAAQVLVAFTDRRVLSYLWDTSAPKGAFQSASSIPFVHIFALVCRSGVEDLGVWLPEMRHVADDYRRAYGRAVPRVKGIRLQINTQHTGTSAESYFGEVAFRSAP